MKIRIPPALADRVSYRQGVLRFRQVADNPVVTLLNDVSALVGGGSRRTREVRVSKEGVFVGPRAQVHPHVGQSVRLVGEPGEAANLFINGCADPLLYVYPRPPGTGPWTTSTVQWLGAAVAMLLDIPWNVEWDKERWDAWDRDPKLRGRTELERHVQLSRKTFPDYHAWALEEPEGTVGLDHATYRLRASTLANIYLHLEPEHLRSERWTVPWESVHSVAAIFSTSQAGNRPHGYLRVAYFDELHDVIWLPNCVPLEGVYLRFVEQEIRTRCKNYVQRTGSEADVPVPLRNLRPDT